MIVNTFFKYCLVTTILILSTAACVTLENTSDEVLMQNGKHVSKMIFKGAISGYEGTTVRDANTKGTSSWNDGDLLYIAFFNGSQVVPGSAVYSSSDGWMVSYDGDLAEGTSQQCEVRFFVNTTFANENLVTLNPNTEIYEDIEGTFNYSDGYITVNATLIPKVGRIRFTGNANDQIHINGITCYSSFSPAGNRFSTTTAMIPLTVNASGSTAYVYGFFTYDDRKIGIVGSDFAYTRTCGSSVFQTGNSGYMKIPSTTSHMNWKTGLTITVNGVDFKMLPVAGYSGGFFLLAETETTEAQYNAVMGSAASTSNYPKELHINTYGNSWYDFITQVNYATGLSFYIPTKAEWQYAASGGILSQGFTYSGSNNPSDVAWYAGNSGGSAHEVKMLSPNELGFYDMSGNVSEWTSTSQYGDSSRYACGGNASNSESAIQVSSAINTFGGDNNGLRIALKCE